MTTNLLPKDYFTHLHDVECNQKYNKNLPYSFHLKMVYLQGLKFQSVLNRIVKEHYLLEIENDLPFEIQAGLWGHDSIEDGRLTYNDIKSLYGDTVAEIIYLCTDYKGKVRADRKPLEYYTELSKNKLAVFVKLCDIIANIKFSLLTNSTMYNYKVEWTDTKHKMVGILDFEEMVVYINNLLEL
jgi:(p)ppGpp synthase/HD superfamily hydrolase